MQYFSYIFSTLSYIQASCSFLKQLWDWECHRTNSCCLMWLYRSILELLWQMSLWSIMQSNDHQSTRSNIKPMHNPRSKNGFCAHIKAIRIKYLFLFIRRITKGPGRSRRAISTLVSWSYCTKQWPNTPIWRSTINNILLCIPWATTWCLAAAWNWPHLSVCQNGTYNEDLPMTRGCRSNWQGPIQAGSESASQRSRESRTSGLRTDALPSLGTVHKHITIFCKIKQQGLMEVSFVPC